MKGKLVLQDGTVFAGDSFGADISVAGEVVFSTGMVGYPESFTDPSFAGQILVLTYPLIGNYGVPARKLKDGILEIFESSKIHIKGLIIQNYSEQYSHWNAEKSLGEWLKEHNIPALCNIDTRALTKKLREHGVMLGKVEFDKEIALEDPNQRNLVADVSCEKVETYEAGKKRVVLVDCGAKLNIIRNFISRDVTVIRVPWNHDFVDSNISFDGVMISNGPGDPKMCTDTIENIQKAMGENIPIFGICLGNQILGLAAGGDTYKLKYGHRSQNQPCVHTETKRCYITSQNHGFAVDTNKLPDSWKPLFYNANDKTNEGIMHTKKPFMSCQFHPEASPGPVDTGFLFDNFIKQL